MLTAVATVLSKVSANGSRQSESRESMCGSPFAARLGGDEFVVIFGHIERRPGSLGR